MLPLPLPPLRSHHSPATSPFRALSYPVTDRYDVCVRVRVRMRVSRYAWYYTPPADQINHPQQREMLDIDEERQLESLESLRLARV